MKKTIATILTVFLFLLTINEASAYGLNGWKRARINTIGYKVDPSMLWTDRSAVYDAISLWENITTNETIHFSESSSYSINFSAQNFGNSGWTGQNINTGSNGIVSLSYTSLNKYYTDSYESFKRTGVWAHEIGHTLGLSDVDNLYVLMHKNDSRVYWSPTFDEINGINDLY